MTVDVPIAETILVVGGGVSGMTAAFEAAECEAAKGLRLTLR
jgi:heterodisulfide reductase subunit A-like polyferredoxin